MDVLAPSGYVSRFLVTKVSWKGQYARVLALSNEILCTLDPKERFRKTNEWNLTEIVRIEIQQSNSTDLTIHFQSATLRMRSLDRNQLLTHLVRLEAKRAFELGIPSKDLLSRISSFQGTMYNCHSKEYTTCLIEIGVDGIYHKSTYSKTSRSNLG